MYHVYHLHACFSAKLSCCCFVSVSVFSHSLIPSLSVSLLPLLFCSVAQLGVLRVLRITTQTRDKWRKLLCANGNKADIWFGHSQWPSLISAQCINIASLCQYITIGTTMNLHLSCSEQASRKAMINDEMNIYKLLTFEQMNRAPDQRQLCVSCWCVYQ